MARKRKRVTLLRTSKIDGHFCGEPCNYGCQAEVWTLSDEAVLARMRAHVCDADCQPRCLTTQRLRDIDAAFARSAALDRQIALDRQLRRAGQLARHLDDQML
jgi:hypothetical protein